MLPNSASFLLEHLPTLHYTVGHCIGLPFSSQERYPVMPPFNVPGLAGWVRNKKKQSYYVHTFAQHPVDEKTYARAVYLHNKPNTEWRKIYLSAPDSATMVTNIPISGVTVLVSGGKGCAGEDK